jgi:arginine decarboxylase
VSFEDAPGRLSSEIVTVYPPGIPILVPGEVITGEVTDYLKNVKELGGTVDGLSEEGLIGVVI